MEADARLLICEAMSTNAFSLHLILDIEHFDLGDVNRICVNIIKNI